MKVRCIKLVNSNGVAVEGLSNGWLRIGEDYDVLCIYGGAGKAAISYRVLAIDGTPAMQPAQQFETVVSALPSGWEFNIDSDSRWSLEPAAWAKAGFWEAFFDQNVEAEKVFAEEAETIKTFNLSCIKGASGEA